MNEKTRKRTRSVSKSFVLHSPTTEKRTESEVEGSPGGRTPTQRGRCRDERWRRRVHPGSDRPTWESLETRPGMKVGVGWTDKRCTGGPIGILILRKSNDRSNFVGMTGGSWDSGLT